MSALPMIIAIDGPAAAGKGTLARALAGHFGYAYLDTGSLYRAVGISVLRAGGEPADEAAAFAAAEALDTALLQDPALRSEAAGEAASVVAAMPRVRGKLLEFQRNFAANPPGGAPGAVIDGRDIGSVVCPDAQVKIFVTASARVRARRRTDELLTRGEAADFDAIMADIEARDARDQARPISPLVQAADALLLDTSNLDIEGAFRAALDSVARAQDASDR
jgi:cytidylate kinase